MNNKLIVSIALLSVAVICTGAGKKKPVAVKPTAVVAEPTMIMKSTVAVKAPVVSLNDPKASTRLVTAQEAIGDLTADFALVVPGAGKEGSTFTAQGKMWVASGRRYVVAYEQPEKQRLVSNGSKRWLYMEKINQVQIQSLPPAGNPNEFFLELGGGLPTMIKKCSVRFLPQDSKHPDWEGFVLTPKKNTSLGFTQAKMWLAGKQLAPRRVVVEGQRQVRVDFSNVRVHSMETLLREPEKGVDTKLFTFEIPKGAEVIEMF